jgi:acyl carrier protein
MFEKVQAILAKQLRIDAATIKPESRIKNDLGADSLDILQLLMTIEEEYGVTIPDEQLAAFETVEDVVKFLESLDK